MKKNKIAGITIILMIAGAMTSFAQSWYQENESWRYQKADGSMAQQEWIEDSGVWYYLNEDGVMVTGWFKDTDQNWYYLKSDGSMARQEWIQEDGNTYYLDGAGRWTENSSGYESEVDVAEAERLREWAEYLEQSANSGEVEPE